MKKPFVLTKVALLAGFVIGSLIFGGIANAEINVLALDTSDWDTQILDAITGIAYTVVSPADFMSINLLAFDVLYVPSTFQDGSASIPSQEALDALNARASDIASFVASGRGVVALSEPTGTGCYTWGPISITVAGRLQLNEVHIIEPEHPVMEGLTDEGLSNWSSSYHNVFTDTGSFTVLAVGVDMDWLPLTLAGTYGSGRIVLTGQDADYHYADGGSGQDVELLQNAIDWVAPEFGSIKGIVTDCQTGKPIKGTLIIAIQQPTKVKTFTDEGGTYYIFDLVPGFWWLLGIKKGYKLHLAKVEVKTGEVTKHEFCMEPK